MCLIFAIAVRLNVIRINFRYAAPSQQLSAMGQRGQGTNSALLVGCGE